MPEIAATFKEIQHCNVRSLKQGQVARLGPDRIVTFTNVVFRPKPGQTIQECIMKALGPLLGDRNAPWTVIHHGTHWYTGEEGSWSCFMGVVQKGVEISLKSVALPAPNIDYVQPAGTWH